MKRSPLFRWPMGASCLSALLMGCAVLVGGCSPQAKQARHLTRAEHYFQAGQYREAGIEYMNVLKGNPTNRIAVRGMGLTLYEIGEAHTALPYLLKAEALGSDDLEIQMKLGSLYLIAGDLPQSRKRADSVLKKSPDHLGAMVLWGAGAATLAEVDAAIVRLSAFKSKFADIPKFSIALASLYLRKGAFDQAEEIYRKALETKPNAWEIHLALGDLYLLKHDSILAGKEYQIAADLSPSKSLARVKRARFLWTGGGNVEAKAILDPLLKLDPQFSAAGMARAEIALGERDYDVAMNLLNGILKLSPSNLDAFLLLQRVNLAQGKMDEAIAAYKKLVSAFPKAAQGRYLLGTAWLLKGDIQKAIGECERALALDANHLESIRLLSELYIRSGQPDRSLALLKPYLKQHPREGNVYVLIGAAYGAKKDFAQAADTYRELMKLMPDSAQGPHLLGLALRRMGRDTEAISMFEEALKREPSLNEALEQLVETIAARSQNWDGVVTRINKQIELAPGVAGHYYLLGSVYVQKRDWDQAEKAFQKAIELKPEITSAYVGLSQVYVQTHKEDQALSKLDKALTVNSNDVTALMMKASLLTSQKDLVSAAAQYQRILTFRPSFVPALNNLACLYQENPQMIDKAFELAKRARTLAPRDPHVADTLGWILYLRGDTRWAVTLLQEAVENFENQPEVHYHLGMCQAALGDESAARTSFSKVMDIAKPFAGFEEAKGMLAVLSAGADLSEFSTAEQVEVFLDKYPRNPFALVKSGAFYQRTGNPEHARMLYEKAISINPNFVPGLIRLADLWAGSFKQLDRAMVFAKQAREAAPGDSQVADKVASIAYLKGDYKWVQSLMMECINRSGATPDRQYLLGMSLYVLGKTDAGTNQIVQALSASTGFASAPDAKRFMERVTHPDLTTEQIPADEVTGALTVENLPLRMYQAAIQEQRGTKDRARSLYEQMVAQYPDFSPAYRRLALLSMGQEAYSDQEFKVLVRARELLPDDSGVGMALGEAAYLKGQYEWASRLLQESTAHYPDKADVHYYLGLSYHQLKNVAAARKALSRGLELDPQSKLAPKARELLGRSP